MSDITITITPHLEENYLHVAAQGMGNYDNAVTMWSSIAQACEQYQCFNVLGEQNLLQTVTIAEAFDHPAL